MLRRLFLVLRILPAKQQPAVNFRMQRLHAPAEHLRPARKMGNVAHRHSGLAQQFRRSARRKNFNLQGRQPLRKFHDSRFVKHAD
jgi:hypothetical protein